MWNDEQSLRGLMNKREGEHFEAMIEASLIWYKLRGVADIEKTPEPMKQLSKPNKKGQFLACYTKAAQPDFKGTLSGGRSIVFEAKHTDTDRMKYDRVTKEQRERLEFHHNLGAVAFVLVGFGLQDVYRIPWEVWRNMKAIYGHQYITPAEIEKYRVQYMSGVLKLLELCEAENDNIHRLLSRRIYPDLCVVCGKYVGEGAHVCLECQERGGAK